MKQLTLLTLIPLILAHCGPPSPGAAEDLQQAYVANITAHHLCAGTFVVGRHYQRPINQVLEEDVAPFTAFQWNDGFNFELDPESRTVTVSGTGFRPRRARYHDDQGCTILPVDGGQIFFHPTALESSLAPADTLPWPMGDLAAVGEFPEIDTDALGETLSTAVATPNQHTRAIVVVFKGKILAESYAPGWNPDTPQISWSMGKSITSALIGVLVQRGELTLDDPAPIDIWQQPGDPRSAIQIKHLLRMSSGLGFENLGLQDGDSYVTANEHMRIYFDSLNVFEHATDQPAEIPPDSQFRYRNSDPLSLGKIIRDRVEASGDEYLTFPQRALFDRIGARNFVLETDAWGNFIMTGYDFGSARDWARFGLLHLWDGVFAGERILPEGWVEFVSTPAPGDPSQGYGGLFWLNRGGSMDRVPEDAFWAAGFMGQRNLIVPSLDLVVVRLGPSGRGFSSYFNDLVGDVIDLLGGS